MPTYTGDPTRVSASIEVLPKDSYEFTIGEPKAFEKDGKKGKNWGIRYTMTVVSEGAHKGKKYFNTLYQHSDAAQPINKRFILSAFGYELKAEKQFDKDFADRDWGFDTDSGSCGDGWRELTGKRVIGDFDVKLDEDGVTERQDVKGWRPI